MQEQYFYRKYIKGVISKANKQQNTENSNRIYNELTKWLRHQNIKLEKEMFKAVLATSRAIAKEYMNSGKIEIKDCCDLYAMSFHTFTGDDGIHTDSKQLKKYVELFFPVLKERLDIEKELGDVNLRYRKVDVVCLGRLFDQILASVDESNIPQLAALMDEFVKSDLEE